MWHLNNMNRQVGVLPKKLLAISLFKNKYYYLVRVPPPNNPVLARYHIVVQ
jgi:hypothetical protein